MTNLAVGNWEGLSRTCCDFMFGIGRTCGRLREHGSISVGLEDDGLAPCGAFTFLCNISNVDMASQRIP